MRHHALSCFLVYIVCQSAMLLFVCEIHALLSRLGICPKLVMKDFVLEYCGMKAIESEMQYLLCASYNHGNIKVQGYSCVFLFVFLPVLGQGTTSVSSYVHSGGESL